MEYAWAGLAFVSAFGQALAWAIKKRALENAGVNNTLGAVSFAVAGALLALLWVADHGFVIPPLRPGFGTAAGMVVALNVLAAWAAYRALDRAALSALMPYMALTAIAVIPVEYALRGVFPDTLQIIGAAFIVAGAIAFSARRGYSRDQLPVALYFAITLACYSFATVFMAVAVEAAGSGLFAAACFHIGIACGFAFLVLGSGEHQRIRVLRERGAWSGVLWPMLVAGLVLALIENGPATIALETASAAQVTALKRTMPLFALALGVFMFRERVTGAHVFGTALMVAGSIAVVWFS